GDGSQLGAQLRGGYGKLALGERYGGLPGAAADLGHPGLPVAGRPDQIVEQLRRTDWPGALVVLRRAVESGTQAAPLLITRELHGCPSSCSIWICRTGGPGSRGGGLTCLVFLTDTTVLRRGIA